MPVRVRSIRDLTAAIRGRREELGISQGQLAAAAGVSRKWVNEFEAGKPTAEFGLLLRVLDALDLQLELSAPSRTPNLRKRKHPEPKGGETVDLDVLIDQLRTPNE
jgi:HTH-type transcriptional regulator / antitoxin HipB